MRAALGLAPAERRAADTPPANPAPVQTPVEVAGIAVTLRVQRRLALRTMALLIGALMLLPIGLALVPGLEHVRLVGIPVSWLLLGVAAYPALLLLAAHHRRAVDRLEGALARREASAPD